MNDMEAEKQGVKDVAEPVAEPLQEEPIIVN